MVSVTRLCLEVILFLTQQTVVTHDVSCCPTLGTAIWEVSNGMPRYHWVSAENSNALKLKPNAGDGSDDQTLLGESEMHVSRHFSQSGRRLENTVRAFL